MLWRAWSHWRGLHSFTRHARSDLAKSGEYAAWKASQYLSELMDSKHVKVNPSQTLDDVYRQSAQSTDEKSSAGRLLLSKEMVARIVRSFRLTKEEQHELERAVSQSQMRIEAQQQTKSS